MFLVKLLLFLFSIVSLLFLPGYLLILAFFKKNISDLFSPLEVFILSPTIGLVVFDLIVILGGELGFAIDLKFILGSISLFSLACLGVYRKKSSKQKEFPTSSTKSSLIFNKNQTSLIVLILFLTIFIKTVYLKDSALPTSTDLGHHMYWSKIISLTGELPQYRENEIISEGENYRIENNSIDDFIIGEHLIFSGVNILTGLDFISYFPMLLLFLFNIFGLLTIFILAFRVFEIIYSVKNKLINPANLSIFTLFISGPVYATTSPQAKFVSGGVVGNLIGNLLIPVSLYFFLRAVKEKNSWFLIMGLLSSAGIFYSHHLSGLIFIFIIIFILTFFMLTTLIEASISSIRDKKNPNLSIFKIFPDLSKLFFAPQVAVFFILLSIFTVYIHMPAYIINDAKGTALGAPSKSTRAGLNSEQFKYAVGEIRLILGIIGGLSLLGYFFFIKKSKQYIDILAIFILIGWAFSVSLLTLKPQWLLINVPSDRVSHYANFPFLILASVGLFFILEMLVKLNSRKVFKTKIIFLILGLSFLTLSFQGFYDNNQSLSNNEKNQKALQTYHLSDFLATRLISGENSISTNILKDHNYISADAWMKLFFMQDPNFPLSRGYFKRYEDPTKPREMCTLWMISEPASERATRCFEGTGVEYVIVDTTVDGPQFINNSDFDKIYESPSLSIFAKSKK
ncbi:MAG: hypothetical protein V3574_00385 [Candidatus Moraniibacteriota bacterium]